MGHTVGILAPGAMGSAIGGRLVRHGVTVLTSLRGRSAASRARAQAAGMQDAEDERSAAKLLISKRFKGPIWSENRYGSRSRTRTYDRAINSRLLYQLSYSGPVRAL